jgi:hypothetical protein
MSKGFWVTFKRDQKTRTITGLFRLHEPVEAGETRPVLRLVRDCRKLLWKQRFAMRHELIRRGARLRTIIRYIRTGDSGNIPQFEEF